LRLRRLAPTLACLTLLTPIGRSNSNLLANPGAETGDLTGWTDPTGNGFNIGTTTVPGSHPPFSGAFCFWAGVTGPTSGAWTNEIRQDVDLSALAASIDAGGIDSWFAGRARTASAGPSNDPARVVVEFLNSGFGVLASFDTGTVLPTNTWVPLADFRTVPVGTRTVRVRLLGARSNGGSTDALFDALSLIVGSSTSSYCTAGTSASGCQALLSARGAASATAAAGFTITASPLEGGKDGLFFFGTSGRQANPWGNGTSYQCVVPPVKRAGLLTGRGTTGLCDGILAQDFNALWNAKPAKNPGSGTVVQVQLWYRDPQNTSNQTTSLSDAIEFTVGL